jgi:hypothetical protein
MAFKETLMSEKSAVPTKEQPLQEPSAANGVTKESWVERCANTAADESEIAALAYRFWQERGCPQGSSQEDWFLAEGELRPPSAPLVAPEENSPGTPLLSPRLLSTTSMESDSGRADAANEAPQPEMVLQSK